VDTGAGETVARWERSLLSAAPVTDGWAGLEVGGPLRLHREEVPPGWVDYNGHVHESRYLQLVADATDALLRLIGVDNAYVAGTGSFYTVETHLSHLGQAFSGDRVTVDTQVLRFDGKRLHVFHRLTRDGDGEELATAEQMLLHVNAASGRAGSANGEVARRASDVAAAHAGLPRPERAGRAIASG
ncbi:MAG: carnitine 3-dehydrogenase, partial [Solirubrobacteraceae bacterium]|nr:carnitine 3-dehydrogenase [Solirubrobacteraceae bacterium]